MTSYSNSKGPNLDSVNFRILHKINSHKKDHLWKCALSNFTPNSTNKKKNISILSYESFTELPQHNWLLYEDNITWIITIDVRLLFNNFLFSGIILYRSFILILLLEKFLVTRTIFYIRLLWLLTCIWRMMWSR